MPNIMNRQVTAGDREICYQLEQKNVKNVNMRIRKDGSIYISANPAVQPERIDEFVCNKSEYIFLALQRFAELNQYAPQPKQYVSGETFYLLGRGIRLKVEKASKDVVYTDGVYLYLQMRNPNDAQKRQRMISKYLDGRCKEIFSEIMDEVHPMFLKYGVERPVLRIRDMETRWGSCLPKKGVITLNKRLLEAPRDCIIYVVTHEFCHFIHPNHSKHFYAFLAMLMPDWKERKQMLEKSVEHAGFVSGI